MINTQKLQTLTNFKKAHSLLSKITKMVEDDKYCIEIMQQNLAAIGLLKSANQMLMENHLNTCFKQAMTTKNDRQKQAIIEEILTVTKLSGK